MKRWLAAGACLAGAAGFWVYRSQERPEPRAAAYAAAASCRGCHAEVWKTYRLTGMGRSFGPFSPERTAADFTKNNRFYHAASDRYYSMIRRGGEAFMRRHQKGLRGEEINVVEKRIDYVMGSGHKARTLIHRNGRNELIELPVAWYTARGGYWAMNPNYDRPDHEDFRRRIRYDCFFCHNAYPGMGARPDDFHADPVYPAELPAGIDCQRCHGPGQAHVEAAAGKAPAEKVRALIVNPKRLPRERQLEICMQCHLQSTSLPLPHSIVKTGRGVFSFRAGEPLGDYTLFFDHPAGAGYDDKFEIAHAAYRLRQSECFRKSAMTCTTCHNPHDVKRGEEAAAIAGRACRSCHAQPAAAGHAGRSECVSCHMVQRRTEDAVEVVMTDHRIARRPAAGDPAGSRKERSGAPYRGEVAAYYPAKPDALHYAIAQVRTGTNLSGGLPLLEKASRDPGCGADCLFELSEAYGKAGRFEDAARTAEETLKREPGHLHTLRSYGTHLSAKGELARGAELLEKALRQAPDHPRTLHDLAVNYLRQGRQADALRLLEEALRADPDSPEIHFTMAGVKSSVNDWSGAAAELREAIRAKPDYGVAHASLAALLSQQNQEREAEFHWRQAVRHAPENARVRHMYGTVLMRQQRSKEATGEFEAAVRLEPGNDEARFFLGVLLAEQGQASRAAEHLQQASRSAVAEIRERSRRVLQALGGAAR